MHRKSMSTNLVKIWNKKLLLRPKSNSQLFKFESQMKPQRRNANAKLSRFRPRKKRKTNQVSMIRKIMILIQLNHGVEEVSWRKLNKHLKKLKENSLNESLNPVKKKITCLLKALMLLKLSLKESHSQEMLYHSNLKRVKSRKVSSVVTKWAANLHLCLKVQRYLDLVHPCSLKVQVFPSVNLTTKMHLSPCQEARLIHQVWRINPTKSQLKRKRKRKARSQRLLTANLKLMTVADLVLETLIKQQLHQRP